MIAAITITMITPKLTARGIVDSSCGRPTGGATDFTGGLRGKKDDDLTIREVDVVGAIEGIGSSKGVQIPAECV